MAHKFVQFAGLYWMRPRLILSLLSLGLIKSRKVELCQDLDEPDLLFIEFDCDCHNSGRENRCWVELGWTERLFYDFRKVSGNSTSLEFPETCSWCNCQLPEGCGGLFQAECGEECRLNTPEPCLRLET